MTAGPILRGSAACRHRRGSSSKPGVAGSSPAGRASFQPCQRRASLNAVNQKVIWVLRLAVNPLRRCEPSTRRSSWSGPSRVSAQRKQPRLAFRPLPPPRRGARRGSPGRCRHRSARRRCPRPRRTSRNTPGLSAAQTPGGQSHSMKSIVEEVVVECQRIRWPPRYSARMTAGRVVMVVLLQRPDMLQRPTGLHLLPGCSITPSTGADRRRCAAPCHPRELAPATGESEPDAPGERGKSSRGETLDGSVSRVVQHRAGCGDVPWRSRRRLERSFRNRSGAPLGAVPRPERSSFAERVPGSIARPRHVEVLAGLVGEGVVDLAVAGDCGISCVRPG